MDSFYDSKRSASIRGYILRSLVKGMHFSCLVKTLSNNMLANGVVIKNRSFLKLIPGSE